MGVYYDLDRHLVADSMGELHEFAASVGIRRCWFDSDRRHPHYDIPLYLRDAVARSKAQRVSGRKILEVSRRLRMGARP